MHSVRLALCHMESRVVCAGRAPINAFMACNLQYAEARVMRCRPRHSRRTCARRTWIPPHLLRRHEPSAVGRRLFPVVSSFPSQPLRAHSCRHLFEHSGGRRCADYAALIRLPHVAVDVLSECMRAAEGAQASGRAAGAHVLPATKTSRQHPRQALHATVTHLPEHEALPRLVLRPLRSRFLYMGGMRCFSHAIPVR